MITHILKHPEKLERIISLAFKSMDSNSNGVIDKIELENIMVSMADDLGMEQPSRGEIDDMIKDLDQGNGELFTMYTIAHLERSFES